jgi:hypothetical protein
VAARPEPGQAHPGQDPRRDRTAGGRRHAAPARRGRRRDPEAPAAWTPAAAPAPASLTLGEGAAVALAASAVALVAFGVLSVLAFTRPTSTLTSGQAAYRQSGRFGYSAGAPGGIVYPARRLETGDPVFLRLVDRLDLRFAYRLTSAAPRAVHGTANLSAQLVDATGWKHTFPLERPTPFTGDRATLAGVLDLTRVSEVLRRFEMATQSTSSTYTLTVEPRVRLSGTLGTQPFAQTFAPDLRLTLDPARLVLEPPVPAVAPTSAVVKPPDPLAPVSSGAITFRRPAPAMVSLSRLRVSVDTARVVAPIGAAASLLVLLFVVGRLLRGRRADEPTRIGARYAELLVPVSRSDRRSYDQVIEVTGIEALAHLAARYDRMILHEQSEFGHSYRVVDDGILYAYHVDTAPEATAPSLAETLLSDDVSIAEPRARMSAEAAPRASARVRPERYREKNS